MRLVRVLAGACVLILSLPLFAVGVSAGTPRTPSEAAVEPPGGWFNLPYFNSQYGWFRVVTNDQVFGGTQISAMQSLGLLSIGASPEEVSGITQEALWAKNCKKKKAQTITLTRKVFLPGAADRVQASLFAVSNSYTKSHPITWISLKVNGSQILKVTKAQGIPDVNSRKLVDLNNYGSEFVYGENTITITAHKKATKKPHPVDGAYCVGDNIFGAAGELFGEFTSDVSSTVGHGQGTGTVSLLPVTVTNNGPTHLFPGAGSFSLYATTSSTTILTVTGGVNGSGSAILDGCTNNSFWSDGHGTGMLSVCPLPHLAPDESLNFNVLVAYEQRTCPSDPIYFTYSAPGYFESSGTTANNGAIDRTISCASS